MAKKQITEKELLASEANAEFVRRNSEDSIESEADSLSLEEIKSKSPLFVNKFKVIKRFSKPNLNINNNKNRSKSNRKWSENITIYTMSTSTTFI